MRVFAMLFLVAVACWSVASYAAAPGDVERGRELFNDPALAGGTSGKSCNSCHPDGKGLEKAGGRKEWKMMGKKFSRLEDVINYDIEKALHGKPIGASSEQMRDLAAYIRSLGRK